MGPTHALCVNATGEVYVWGKNNYTSPQGVVKGILGPCGSMASSIQVLKGGVKGRLGEGLFVWGNNPIILFF